MHKFDYTFLKSKVPSSIVGLAEIIFDLNAKKEIRKMQYASTFEALRQKAVVDSARESNAIEGIETSEKRFGELMQGTTPLNHDEMEITGYRDALRLIHEEYSTIDVSEDMIKTFHRLISFESRPHQAGKYKAVDNFIMDIYPDGTRKIRFTPVAATDTEEAMRQLLLAYYTARQDDEIHPLLLIPCVVLDFLCIHPFLDGNGRVSRLLTLLLLYKSGYDIGRYASIEKQISTYKEQYYSSLSQSSAGWHENKNNYDPFLIYFYQILYRCYKEIDGRFIEISEKKASKTERVENILLNSMVPISKKEVCDRLPDISVKTIELVISKLQKEKRIKKIGSYKDARYYSDNRSR